MVYHRGGRIALFIANFLVFAGTVAINYLSVFPQYAGGLFHTMRGYATTYGLGVPPQGFFESTVGNLSAKYEIDVTPAGFTFMIWSVIYIWLLLAHLYALILMCRRNAVGPVYTSPSVLTSSFLLTYTFNLMANVAWLFVWDNELIVFASALLWFIVLTNWMAFGMLHYSVYRHGPWMCHHAKVDLWMYRVLWHNGMALYTTWSTIAALLNLGVALRYAAGLDMQYVVYVVLGALSGIMILWFVLENTILDRYVRYTITPYAVVIVALVGIYIKQYAESTTETGYFIVVLLGVAVFCFVARLGLVIVRACKNPLYVNNKIGDDPVLSFAA
ncbi:uncharacterized protein [Procambarus clarkii]|uniref:uncharacterized protein n=1 Tax=Procambarus clarkii TaxID=6728 RepID=UPI001E671542|nr:uncharacterized protein LOC123770780 [Procambarus clarkii]